MASQASRRSIRACAVFLAFVLPANVWGAPLSTWLGQHPGQSPYLEQLQASLVRVFGKDSGAHADISAAASPLLAGTFAVEIKDARGIVVLRADCWFSKDKSMEVFSNLSSKDPFRASALLADAIEATAPPAFKSKKQLGALLAESLSMDATLTLVPANKKGVSDRTRLRYQFKDSKPPGKPFLNTLSLLEDLAKLRPAAEKVQIATYEVVLTKGSPDLQVVKGSAPAVEEEGVFVAREVSHGTGFSISPNQEPPAFKMSQFDSKYFNENANPHSKTLAALSKSLLKAMRPDATHYEAFVDTREGFRSMGLGPLSSDECKALLDFLQQSRLKQHAS